MTSARLAQRFSITLACAAFLAALAAGIGYTSVGTVEFLVAGDEFFFLPALRFNFTRQGYLRVDKGVGHEYFAHQRFRTGRWMVDGGAQWTKWLNVGVNVNKGPAIFYDPLNPFQGRQRNLNARIGLQPSARLNNQINYTFAHFDSVFANPLTMLSIWNTMKVGVLTALVGGALFAVVTDRDRVMEEFNLASIGVAFIGACLFLLVLKAIAGSRRRSPWR